MESLKFIQKLKQTLLEVEVSGLDNIFFVETNYDLVRKLKRYAIRQLRETNTENPHRPEQYGIHNMKDFINDLLSRDIFNLRIRYCVVKLKELSIEKDEYFGYISQAINLFIGGKSTNFDDRETTDMNHLIALELSNCFQPWYRPEDVFLIDFAEQRQLIIAIPQHRSWRISNLGHYFLRMPTFEAIAFLCALEVVMTLERYQNRYISLPILEDLALGRIEKHRRYPYSLSLFGIIPKTYPEEKPHVSQFGKSLLAYVRTNLARFQELFLFLIEAQTAGFEYEDEDKTASIVEYVMNSSILIDAQKKSIETALNLYKSGDHLDSLRILYPVLEGTIDTVIKSINLNPSDFKGMKSKLEKLEKEGLISARMSTGLEIFASRNKVSHGNILETDVELAHPLFYLILAYLRRLLTELNEV